MTEPIPVPLAIRAVERAIRECDAATPGPWAWFPFAEKSNSFSLGVGYDRHGKPAEGRVDPYDLADTLMEGAGEIGAMEASTLNYADPVFMCLARAGFRASLEYLRRMISLEDPGYPVNAWISAAVAPLIAHYDATAPGWREEA